jgi:hypothetical protein
MRYVHLYNTQLPQPALGSRTPMQVMKDGTNRTRNSSTNHCAVMRAATVRHQSHRF